MFARSKNKIKIYVLEVQFILSLSPIFGVNLRVRVHKSGI